jgi:ABC-type Fe3+/spermidine/putrescine transport system ATPase subunit
VSAPPAAAALELVDVHKRFDAVEALRGVTLVVQEGEFVTLLGPSGCGKSTLLRIVAGFDAPSAGRVSIAGRDVVSLPPERRPVNMVFQRYALFPHKDVWENVAFGLRVSRVGAAELRERVREAIALVQLEGLERRSVEQLSGGQQQRVALARAVVNRPALLLLDEPLGALDLQLRKQMQLELRAVHRRLGTTFIYVTHDQEESLVMSDRVVVMNGGVIEQAGAPDDVYRRPASRFVARFIGETNLLEGTAEGGMLRLEGIGAVVPIDSPAGGPAAVSVRPEHVRIGAQPGLVRGVLEDSIFLGSLVRHDVRVGNGTVIRVQEGPKEAAARRRGESVEIGWDVADAVVVTR